MKVLKILLAFAAVLVLFALGAGYWLYSSLNTPIQHTKADGFVTIEKGSTPRQIVSKLADEGIISSAWAATVYLRTLGDASKLQAGEYQFKSPITTLEAFKELESGKSQTVRVVIPEGFTRFDIAKRLVEKFPQDPPVSEAEVVRLMDDTKLIADIAPQAKNLEGYMYPSTYSLPRDTKPETAIALMVEQFKKVWKPEWTMRAQQIGRSPQEIVTIASLIETESGVEAERPVVASVIYNRLGRGIALGIDQTAVYIAKMENRWDGTINRSDLDSPSPYNTRKFPGLPPGPISSVSESAIEAALNPATTDFLYYVRNVDVNDGSHWFYASAAEFEKGKAKYQQWLEKERVEKREQEANPQ
jgi:UPF0755 protein